MTNLSRVIIVVSVKTDEMTFPFVGNNLAIDFLNTQIVDRGEIIELLNEPQDLYDWACEAGISVDSNVKNQELVGSLELRRALKDIFLSVLNNQTIPKKTYKIFNQYLLNHLTEQKLTSVNGVLVLQPIHKKLSIDNLLGFVANEAALLLTSKKINKLKRCSNPKCILLFLDISKAGKRRWCSMDVCGNRAKAANHYINSKQL